MDFQTLHRRQSITKLILLIIFLAILIPLPILFIGLIGIVPWFFSLLVLASMLGVYKRLTSDKPLGKVDKIFHVVACTLVVLILLYILFLLLTSGIRSGFQFFGSPKSLWTVDSLDPIAVRIYLLTFFYGFVLVCPFILMRYLNIKSITLPDSNRPPPAAAPTPPNPEPPSDTPKPQS